MGNSKCLICRFYFDHRPEKIAAQFNSEACICTDCLNLLKKIKVLLKDD